MSQITPNLSNVELHKKRESGSLFDPDLVFEDSIISHEGIINPQDLFKEFSAEEKLDDEKAQELLQYSPHLDQEFKRKYMMERNPNPDEKYYTHIGDDQVVDEDFANFYRFPRTERYKRIPAGDLYRVPNDSFKTQMIERSKSFVKELFPPYNLKDGELMKIQEQLKDKN